MSGHQCFTPFVCQMFRTQCGNQTCQKRKTHNRKEFESPAPRAQQPPLERVTPPLASGVCLDAPGQWRGPLLSSVWTRHRAVKHGQSGGSVGTTSLGKGKECREVRIAKTSKSFRQQSTQGSCQPPPPPRPCVTFPTSHHFREHPPYLRGLSKHFRRRLQVAMLAAEWVLRGLKQRL